MLEQFDGNLFKITDTRTHRNMIFGSLYNMSFKSPLTILGSIIALTALMLLLLEPPGRQPQKQVNTKMDRIDSVAGTQLNKGDTSNTNRSTEKIQTKISQAANNESFKILVNEILKVKDAQRKKKLLLSMYNRWVQLDMQAALDSAIMFKEQNKNDGVLDYVLITSGKIKFPVVYKWLMARIEDEGEKKVFTNMLFYEVARDSSPAFVLTYINLIENDVLKEGIMRLQHLCCSCSSLPAVSLRNKSIQKWIGSIVLQVLSSIKVIRAIQIGAQKKSRQKYRKLQTMKALKFW